MNLKQYQHETFNVLSPLVHTRRLPHLGVPGLLQRVTQVRVLIVLAGQSLLSGASLTEKLPLLAVAPFHSPVLKPNLNLIRKFGLDCLICKLKSILFLVLT